MNFAPLTPLTDVVSHLRRGDLDAVQLTEELLARIERLDPVLGVYLARRPERSLEAARASDARRARGESLSVLDGVPVALKDNIDVAGEVTSNGLAGGPVARESAPVARRLEAAGAVLLGKVNLHECALGATTDNPHRGRSRNPWDIDRTPGGSSGGSAAAVAAGLCVAAVGTDTLGSVRLPSAYCGIAGLKPTFGLVSTGGVSPLSFRLDHVGPMAPTVADLACMMSVMAGFEAGDPGSRRAPSSWQDQPAWEALEPSSLAGTRLGVIGNFDRVPARDETGDVLAAVLERLRGAGATLVPFDLPHFDARAARRAALKLIEAHASADMARVRTSAHGPFSPGVQAMFEYGARLDGVRLAAAERIVFEAAGAFEVALGEVDAIVSLTTTQTAFPFDAAVPEEQADLTTPANLAGIPALSLPAGLAPNGLPVGIQLMMPAWSDRALLSLGMTVESLLGFSARPAPAGLALA